MPYDRILLGVLVVATLVLYAASGRSQDGQKHSTETTGGVQTLKERLGDKTSDEQRVDNCKVPVERRGPKVRPEGCKEAGGGAGRVGSPQ
jgi:hypothetical protein